MVTSSAYYSQLIRNRGKFLRNKKKRLSKYWTLLKYNRQHIKMKLKNSRTRILQRRSLKAKALAPLTYSAKRAVFWSTYYNRKNRFFISRHTIKHKRFFNYRGQQYKFQKKRSLQFRKFVHKVSSQRSFFMRKNGRKVWVRPKRVYKRNERPFWKWRSYNFVKQYNYICKNYYMTSFRRQFLVMQYKKRIKLKRRKVRRLWHEYYRRNKIKAWFKKKIILRYVWMARYQQWSQRSMARFVRRHRKKSLRMFWQQYEFTLDKYVVWWRLAADYTHNNAFYARMLIRNGYIFVNFVRMYRWLYVVQPNDCIFFLKTFSQKRYLGPDFSSFYDRTQTFKCKYRRQFRFRMLLHLATKKREMWARLKFFHLLEHYSFRKQLAGLNLRHILFHQYFFERSTKYKIIVNLKDVSWRFLAFAFIITPSFFLYRQMANLVIHRRYW